MNVFDRISAYKNIIKIKKLAQSAPLNLNSITSQPSPTLGPSEDLDLSTQVANVFKVNLETRDPEMLKNQLKNMGRKVGQIFLKATQRYDQIKNSPDQRKQLETEFQKAYQTLHENISKNPQLQRPEFIDLLSQGSLEGSNGFNYFTPFSKNHSDSRPPATAPQQENSPKSELNMDLAASDIRRAQKNANEYMLNINRNTGAAQNFYVSRFISYVINPMVMLYQKATNQKQITKPIESLFGTIYQKLNLDQNSTLLGEEATAQIQEIGSKSFVE